VESPLLDESSVQFVGSATIGTDHVDQNYLEEQGIAFAHAPASNADSVADYVVAALFLLACERDVDLRRQTVGIVGCGNIGSRLGRRLSALGLTVLRNDPPLAAADAAARRHYNYVGLDTVLDDADIVTLHVPLTTEGPHPTHHLIDEDALSRLSSEAWLLNTSRGSVVDGSALLAALRSDEIGAAVLDVWEGEPTPDPALIRAVDVATPHIAGYAHDGKIRGTTMLYKALCEHLGVDPTWSAESVLQPDHPDVLSCSPPDPRLPHTDWLHQLVRQAYDLEADDKRMRRDVLEGAPADRGEAFTALRAHYPVRREMQQYRVSQAGIPFVNRTAVEEGLTMQCR
jgi:erythronate-4-phosphate dehydrogenase